VCYFLIEEGHLEIIQLMVVQMVQDWHEPDGQVKALAGPLHQHLGHAG
jgi:hypothetical protein